MDHTKNLDQTLNQQILERQSIRGKVTKLVTDDEISKIKVNNFPMYMRISIPVFKLCHYFLLIMSIIQLLNRRYHEYDDLKQMEEMHYDDHQTEQFFSFTGVIYAKYNLEILNFIFYILIVANFNKLSFANFLAKLVIGEGMLIGLGCVKIINYYWQINELKDKAAITISSLLVEIFLLLTHIIILVTFIIIWLGFRGSRENKNIYRVHYLNKKIRRMG